MGGLRGSLLDSGATPAGVFGTRLDRPELSYEVRLGYADGVSVEKLRIDTRELSVALAALKPLDLGPISVAAGLEVGGSWISQIISDPRMPGLSSFALFAGPLGAFELPLGRAYARIEAGLPMYVLRAASSTHTAGTRLEVSFMAGAGIGVYL
jgi:hypothetical protein